MNTAEPQARSALRPATIGPAAFLVRGLIVGAVAGVLAFAVAYTVGEPHVDQAIALEESIAPAGDSHGDEHSHEVLAAEDSGSVVVSRDTQRTTGLLTGTLAIGIAIGGVVALVAAAAVGRLGSLTARQATAVVALIGFISFVLVPFLKYPATPPAVGSAETIDSRTMAYFGFVLLSVAAAIAAVMLGQRLWRRHGAYVATVAGSAVYLLVIIVAMAALPTANEVAGFPADTLWYFRLSSLLTLTAMWAALGVGLTALLGRLHDRARVVADRAALAASL